MGPDQENNIRQPNGLHAFGRFLRAAREARLLTLDAVAQATGISKPYLSQIETARTPGPPSPAKLRLLAKPLHLDAADLLAAADWLRAPASIRKALKAVRQSMPSARQAPRRPDGAIDLDEWMGLASTRAPLPRRPSADEADSIPLVSVPMINRVAAGAAAEFTDLDYPAGIADQYVPAPRSSRDAPLAAAFAVRIRGDSMSPEYCEGEIIIVGPAQLAGPQDGDDFVVRLGELEEFATTFKRIYFDRDDSGEPVAVRLIPLNAAHPERRVPMEQVTGIYPLLYRLIPARKADERAARKDPPVI